MISFDLVFAATRSGAIGKNGDLPWPKLKEDMKLFRTLTTPPTTEQKVVLIMGAKTWLSFKGRLLPKREHIVISSKTREELKVPEEVQVVPSFATALDLAATVNNLVGVFVIGGAALYEESQHHPNCRKVYMTSILAPEFPADVYFKLDERNFDITKIGIPYQDGDVWCQTLEYTRKSFLTLPPEGEKKTLFVNHEEIQYLNLVDHLIKNGIKRDDRTGQGTVSVFGVTHKYNLRNGHIPLLTTKKVYWKGVVEELRMFLSGVTDEKKLNDKGVKIWKKNADDYHKQRIDGGDKKHIDGDLGKFYSFQWRHFGADYVDCNTDYTGKGVDQIAYVINEIKNNPNSRRIFLSAWNPKDIIEKDELGLSKLSLPPCHISYQWYVANGELSCILYLRSQDVALGLPFNIASVSLLTFMIAHVCGLRPGELTHIMGDTHLYLNHIEPIKEQLTRIPKEFPKLKILKPASEIKDISEFTFKDFELIGYENVYPPIKMEMAV